MVENEIGTEIPEEIIELALSYGSVKCPKYVYKDEEYGGKSPVASIGCYKPTRFGRVENAEKYKVELKDGWVVFLSPSRRSAGKDLGKGRCDPCIVCGEDRWTEESHFPTPKSHDGDKVIPLCPTHHRLLDSGRISIGELKEIWLYKYDDFDEFDEFMEWANEMDYPYSIEDIEEKKIYKDFEEVEICYKIEK